MTQDEYIKSQVATWGEDYVDSLLDRGYIPVQLVMYGKLRWWWILPTTSITEITDGGSEDLTQTDFCATMPASRPVVSPVSTGMLT